MNESGNSIFTGIMDLSSDSGGLREVNIIAGKPNYNYKLFGVLDTIDIKTIELYLRLKKLEQINKFKNE